MEDIRKNIANNIALLRRERNLTQSELAERLNYSDKAISKWERGESVPDIDVLKQVADFFGITVDALISDNPVKGRKKMNAARKHTVIILLSCFAVWLLATVAFFVLDIVCDDVKIRLLSFIYAVPLSFVVWLVLNSVWFSKRINYYIISALMWTALLAVWLSLLIIGGFNLYTLLLFGIPGQILIILWSRFRPRKSGKKED